MMTMSLLVVLQMMSLTVMRIKADPEPLVAFR